MIPLYQRIAHFSGSQMGEDDLLLSLEDQQRLLTTDCWVLEKVDGIAVAVGRTGRRRLEWSFRPPWHGALGGELERALDLYMSQRMDALRALLTPGMTLYGEWCWHRLFVEYTSLPDLFICYGLNRVDGVPLPLEEMQERCRRVGLTPSQPLWRGSIGDLTRLQEWVGKSNMGTQRMEGLIVEQTQPVEGEVYCGKWVEKGYQKVVAEGMTGEKNLLRDDVAGALMIGEKRL